MVDEAPLREPTPGWPEREGCVALTAAGGHLPVERVVRVLGLYIRRQAVATTASIRPGMAVCCHVARCGARRAP